MTQNYCLKVPVLIYLFLQWKITILWFFFLFKVDATHPCQSQAFHCLGRVSLFSSTTFESILPGLVYSSKTFVIYSCLKVWTKKNFLRAHLLRHSGVQVCTVSLPQTTCSYVMYEILLNTIVWKMWKVPLPARQHFCAWKKNIYNSKP